MHRNKSSYMHFHSVRTRFDISVFTLLWLIGSNLLRVGLICQVAFQPLIEGFVLPARYSSASLHFPDTLKCPCLGTFSLQCSNDAACDVELPKDLRQEIQKVAKSLWEKDTKTLEKYLEIEPLSDRCVEGEAVLENGVPFIERGGYFRQKALSGCPKAQHSYALLLWSGFGGIEKNPKASAQWHAVAAVQNHLEAIAVLGGCLRTGTGVSRNVALGLRLIEFSASCGNPAGVNKKAALMESNGDDYEAVRLYEECLANDRANALLLFNLGWSYFNGVGVDRKDTMKGMSMWKQAAEMAPDEGSEEAAFHLYEEIVRNDPREASHWVDIAAELGLEEAIQVASQM